MTEVVRYWLIELYRNSRVIGYPSGTPVLEIDLRSVDRFKLYRCEHYLDGTPMRMRDITAHFIWFQRLWLARRRFLRAERRYSSP